MKKIDTSKWQTFRVGDLFSISRPSSRSQLDYEEGDIPFVASGNSNNGIAKRCQPKKDEILDAGNCITVSPLDGSAFYQPNDFLGRGGAGSAILIMRSPKLNELRGLFVSSVVRRTLTKYSYSDQINSKSLENESIKLPSTVEGEPDWDYMNLYMSEVLRKSEDDIDNLRQSSLKKSLINVKSWKDFVIGDLFEKLTLNIKKENFNKAIDVSEIRSCEFNLPLVNAKHGNNGIMYYGRDEEFESAENTICIVQNGAIATGDVYPEPQRTSVLWDAYLVKPIDKVTSPFVLAYLSTVLEKSIKEKFSYDNKCVWDKVSHLTVKLPVTSEDKIDWDYMDSYMKNVMFESENALNALQKII